MLKISRNINEIIMIGDDIKIILIMTDEGRALIGIDAPKDIPVHRQEIYERNKTILKRSELIKHIKSKKWDEYGGINLVTNDFIG